MKANYVRVHVRVCPRCGIYNRLRHLLLVAVFFFALFHLFGTDERTEGRKRVEGVRMYMRLR